MKNKVLPDGMGRKIEYLRISVTDKCNLRCRYCMPAEGVPAVEHRELLTLEEIAYLVGILAEMGLKKVRLTGGEPLVRKNIEELVWQLHSTPGIRKVAMTTNGVLLEEMLPELVAAGLDAVNISLDTLDRERYTNITGRDCLQQVLKGLDAAVDRDLQVKVNCVPSRELNGTDAVELATLAQDRPVDVRFIELMPIGQGKLFTGIPSEEILTRLTEKYGRAKALPYDGEGPARYYTFHRFRGRVGFISPISHKFCGECNRIRSRRVASSNRPPPPRP